MPAQAGAITTEKSRNTGLKQRHLTAEGAEIAEESMFFGLQTETII
jgi:hypothetical protein